jgi:hypothetical protein
MRRFFTTLMAIIVVTSFSSWAVAKTSTPDTDHSGFNKADAEQIRDAAQGLREVFGVEETATGEQTKKPATTDSSKKTIADVADKAVDMADRMVSKAAESLQKVAPDVWRIMIRQQYVKAISGPILPLTLLAIVLIYYKVLKKWIPDHNNSETLGSPNDPNNPLVFFWIVFQYWIPVVCGIWFSIWFSMAMTESIKYLVNPEFYAVRDMLMMILNKGNGVG